LKLCRVRRALGLWGLAIPLLLLFFAQAVMAGPYLSLTADEPVYMAQGYVYWTRGDFRFQQSVAQPPLPGLLEGAVLVLQPGPAPEELPGWAEADLSRFVRAFVEWYGPSLEAATFVARAPVALVAMVGAACVLRWARERSGRGGGLLALALLVFDPNLLAHAGLATTDVLLAVWGFAGVYAAVRWARGGSTWRWGLATGAALGLALGSKTSGFFPAGIVGLLFVTYALQEVCTLPHPFIRSPSADAMGRRAVLRACARWAGRLALAWGVALLVLWALYRFEVRPLPGGRVALPFATHWLTWGSLQAHMSEGHTAFLVGEVSSTGWWLYYPVTLLLKTPLPTMGMVVAAFVALGRSSPRLWWRERGLWLYPLLYSAMAIVSTIDIGYRFLLVMFPFLYVLAGRLWPDRDRSRWQKILILAGLAWLASGTIRLFPHHLTFFNELAGGPYGGHRYLVDSNLDWGQSFKTLRRFLEMQAETGEVEDSKVYLSYYTYTDPALYGIAHRPIAPAPEASAVLPSRFDPAPGVYVISATTLQGVMVADPDTYDWFRHREPVGRPGVALFVYRVDPRDEPPDWLAQCTEPVVTLSADAAQEGFGRTGLRLAYFDCTSSWLYPDGGKSPGWYVLFQDTARSDDAFVQARLAEGTLSYEQRRAGALPPFVIYEQNSPPSFPRFTPDTPVRIGHLTFLGYAHDSPVPARPGQTIKVETWWRVDSLPGRPLSIMLHLLGPGDAPIAVGDGLGVPIENWRAGDVIVQRHLLALPANVPPGEYTPTTGAYWLDTVERWPIEKDGELIGDQLVLPAMLVVTAGR